MSDFSRVAWTEGMFLRPQHFQQQERSILNVFSSTLEKCNPFFWGIYDVEIDESLLKLSQFGIINLNAQMQDGSSIEIPQKDSCPSPLKIDKMTSDKVVCLAIPADITNGLNLSDSTSEKVTRFSFSDHEAVDNTVGYESHEVIQIAKYNIELKLDDDSLSGYLTVPIARIREVDEDGIIILDETFIPPTLNVQRNKNIKRYISEIRAAIKIRADSLANRLGRGQGTANSIIDFLMLQVLNRYEPLFVHLERTDGTHPESVFKLMSSLVGEMATFSSNNKRPTSFPDYQHEQLSSVFDKLIKILSQYMSTVLEQTAQQIAIEAAQYGIKVAKVEDKQLFENATFILSVKANISVEELRQRFPSQIKIGPVEHIRDLVNNQLTGIAISSLPVAPRQIPYNAGYHYFELEKSSSYWDRLTASGGIALHLSGRYPELDIQLWAIK
ncbi:type VI secretion system baseplate subunit TssK [Vibrio nereis]|uniref:type VI secretion system baseplate subunit TssK n=1 Tax=Vibrio nereis TaxID=693 RepID=UPI002494EA6D|nr:type VI secretion system baseplate subunit TssK [Vibrio nereis]